MSPDPDISPATYATGWDAFISSPGPLLALAPMQDVTTLPFWKLMACFGGADVYYTEYFRVTAGSRLDKSILASITKNPTGRPVIAQLIGNDIEALVRNALELGNYPILAIDLNLGCPAPVVYRKCAGGGLLRDLPRVDAILGALRDVIPGRFTIKTRLGFDDERTIDALLPIFARHSPDLLTVHGRTVKQMYRDGVRYDLIARAVQAMACPVLANGNVSSAEVAQGILNETGARGLMIGRGAIRNPWIFQQIRCHLLGQPVSQPTGRDVLDYIHALYDAATSPGVSEQVEVHAMKKYTNFIGSGLPDSARFLHDIRRVSCRSDFFAVCERSLNNDFLLSLDPAPPDPELSAAA